MGKTKSIVICGVGGQGILLASDILANALFMEGYDVKKNEIHGMSQREGAVISFIRFGEKVYSPVVSPGEALFLIAFEKLEALRNIRYLNPEGIAIINDLEIPPTPVVLGKFTYPPDIEKTIGENIRESFFIKAENEAKKAGNSRAFNTVMLGVLSNFLKEIDSSTWEKAITGNVSPVNREINIKAFDYGRKINKVVH